MWSFLLRSLWRLIILAIGCVLAYGVVLIYPYANDRLPAALVVFLIYVFAAYLAVPFLLRLLRVFVTPNVLPYYAVTGDGWPSDPVNIAVVAKNRKQLEEAMNSTGWHTADPLTVRTGIREITSILFNRAYPEAPHSNLYLFNRPHDIGFSIPTNPGNNARTRHHVRFWRMNEPSENANFMTLRNYQFWHRKLRHILTGERDLWIGAATEDDKPIDFQWRTIKLTHGQHQDSNKERDFIIETLRQAGHISPNIALTEAGESIEFRGQQFRTKYKSNGAIKIVRLR